MTTTVLPRASVVVMTWPGRVPESTTEAPARSVVVTGWMTLPFATVAVVRTDVVVMEFPPRFVVVITVAGAAVRVVIVLPAALVVTVRVVIVVSAVFWIADVVRVIVEPSPLVCTIVTGISTPVITTGIELLGIEVLLAVSVDSELCSLDVLC